MKALYFTDGKAPFLFRTLVMLSSGLLSRVTPQLFTKISLKFFMNPKGKRAYQFENVIPEEYSIKGVHGNIQAYYFKGGDKHILLTHGWADTCKSFESLIEELLDKGFSVWAFDHAGHGRSEGNVSNLFAFIDGLKNTILYIQNQDLELHGIISHSMGGAAVLNLNKNYLSHKKVVLMAAPVRFFEAMFKTFNRIGISARVLTHLLNSISQYYGGDWNKIKPYDQRDKIHQGFLIVHDKNDRQCKYDNMIELISGTPAELYSSEGLGHRRILKEAKTLSKISHFLSKP